MNKLVKDLVAGGINMLGFNYFKRYKNRTNVVILTYHGVLPFAAIELGANFFAYRNVVSDEQFDKQIKYIQRNFKLISLDELKSICESPAKTNTKPYAIITFDDGFENNFTYAYPILKKNNASATFFITPGYMDLKELLWTEEVSHRLLTTKSAEINLELNGEKIAYELNTFAKRENASISLRKILKQSSKKEIISFLKGLRVQTQDVILDVIPKSRYQFMNWKQIKEMDNNGMCIGSHTKDHFLLSNLDEFEAAETLAVSKKIIESHTQKTCSYFAYPNGAKNDCSERDFILLNNLKYAYAFTQIPGFNSIEYIRKHPYKLKRINITNKMDFLIFKAIVSNTWKINRS